MSTQKDIENLELEVQALSNNLKELEKKLVDIDIAILQAVQKSLEDSKQVSTQSSLVRQLSKEEEVTQERYLQIRKERENAVRNLRAKYILFIKQSSNQKSQGGVDLSTSTWLKTLDITQSSGFDEDSLKDYKEAFQGSVWISETDIQLDTNKENKLGSGPSSSVYRGICRGKEVAIKVLSQSMSSEALVTFRKECEVLRSIMPHPNLLLFMGACMEENKHMIVLELAKNGSLDTIFRDKKVKLSFGRKIRIMSSMASALNWLHNHTPPVLHLNLKPSNLLFSSSWELKLTDYGYGKVVSDTSSAQNWYYVAPEILSNPLGFQRSTKSDVYSFGILSWYIFTEKDPYETKDIHVLEDIVVASRTRPAVPAHMPKTLKTLLESCWDSEPTQRPSFVDIVDEKKWEEINLEAVAKGEENAMSYWKSVCKSDDQSSINRVPWQLFSTTFCNFLEVDIKPQQMETSMHVSCLKAILDVDKEGPNKGMVTLDSFQRLLDWFGPIRTGKRDGLAFLDSVVNLLKQSWFHGQIDASTAARRIGAATKVKYGFLVRFSTSDKSYTVTYRDKATKQIMHSRIGKQNSKDIMQVIDKFQKKYHVSPVSYGREYEVIFTPTKKAKSDVQDSFYVNDGTDDGQSGATFFNSDAGHSTISSSTIGI
eukprot:TRINITY_DN11463_c0_g1_i1.p1 TRINITY_DN11463_c0_g1~~TRINITY_DN11463_c0_g1_i1.p1  ORF type:complete len:653 (-),score=165.88 TRINITY_DN11463_c0_g1_i1:60-2018(-)